MEKIKQWYEKLPNRLAEEKLEMEKTHPNFEFFFAKNGNVCWKGKVSVRDNSGKLCLENCEYNPLEIIVECLPDYPQSMPIVYDIKDILKQHNCIHLHPNSNKICYGIRHRDLACNFHQESRIKDIIPQIGYFILGQWKSEQKGNQWDNDRLHGVLGFIEEELLNGNFKPKELCPCGNPKLYKNCCMPEVESILKNIIEKIEENKKIKYKTDFKQKEKCTCKSGSKYKKCCYPRQYFIQPILLFISKNNFFKLIKKLNST